MRSCCRRDPRQHNGPRSVRGRQSASPRIVGGLAILTSDNAGAIVSVAKTAPFSPNAPADFGRGSRHRRWGLPAGRQPASRPAQGRARSRWTSRFLDLYLEPPLRSLFPQVAAAEKDTKLIAEKLTEIAARLDQLEAAIGAPHAVGSAFTLADCSLIPTFFFLNVVPAMLGGKAPHDGRPKIAAWWKNVQERASVKKVLGEMQQALADYQKGITR